MEWWDDRWNEAVSHGMVGRANERGSATWNGRCHMEWETGQSEMSRALGRDRMKWVVRWKRMGGNGSSVGMGRKYIMTLHEEWDWTVCELGQEWGRTVYELGQEWDRTV